VPDVQSRHVGGPYAPLNYSTISPEELVVACLQTGSEGAWREFVRRFQPLIATVALRIARRFGESSSEVVDDLVQETYLKLCSNNGSTLKDFRSTHPDAIFGFIKVFTANLAYDHFKASLAQKRGGKYVCVPADDERHGQLLTSALNSAEQLNKKILVQEIAACLRAVDSGPNAKRDQRIFWLYYRTGLSASAIAALPGLGLNVKGVESTLLRLTRQVRERLVSEKLDPSETEGGAKGIRPAESL
jgi:RNA polymerase sigma-70 factor (ECF subfamily)